MPSRRRSWPGWSMQSRARAGERGGEGVRPPLRQLVEAFAEALEPHREAAALFRRLEDDEGRGRPGAQLLHQILVHHHLGDAAVRQAAHEAGAADVDLIELEPEAR